jgi:hypothetical protein
MMVATANSTGQIRACGYPARTLHRTGVGRAGPSISHEIPAAELPASTACELRTL